MAIKTKKTKGEVFDRCSVTLAVGLMGLAACGAPDGGVSTDETSTSTSETGEGPEPLPIELCGEVDYGPFQYHFFGLEAPGPEGRRLTCTVVESGRWPGGENMNMAVDCVDEDRGSAVSFEFSADLRGLEMPAGLAAGSSGLRLRWWTAPPVSDGAMDPDHWLSIRDAEGRLVMAVVRGPSVSPPGWSNDAPPFISPFSFELVDAGCAPGFGPCHAVGEPALARIGYEGDSIVIGNHQAGRLGGYGVRTSYLWLPDLSSANHCEGRSDRLESIVLMGPPN